MVAWIVIILALAVFHIIGFAVKAPGLVTYINISTVLLLIAALGMLYHHYWKQHSTKRNIAEMKRYNKALSEALKKKESQCSASDILEAINKQLKGDRRRIDQILEEEGKIIRDQLELMAEIERQESK